MTAFEEGPGGLRIRTAQWFKGHESLPDLVAARARAEQEALSAFLAARVAEMPEAERPSALVGPLADDLRRRLRDAASAELAKPGTVLPMPPPNATDETEHAIAIPVDGSWQGFDFHALEANLFSAACERVWLSVLQVWREESGAPASYYRLPFAVRGPHKVLGGRRHGKSVNLPARGEVLPDRVRLTVTLPKGREGSQLSLELESKVSTSAAGLDADSVLKLIREATGPHLAMIGHAAFALAHDDAQREGRVFDGRFWYYPTRIASLLGYSGSGAASRVRDLFAAYGSTILRGTWHSRDGTTLDLSGPLLYPTELEATRRTPGRPGRDRASEWRIRDSLVELTRRDFVLIPTHLLNCGAEDARTWANCMRVYEELAWRFRRNPVEAGAGEAVRVSLAALANGVNLSPPGRTKRSLQIADLKRYMDKLQRRGAIAWESAEVAEGPGALVTLTDPEIRRRLAETGAARAAFQPRSGRRR